jgi:hypothetical protein
LATETLLVKPKLTPEDHVKLGLLLKRARRLLHQASGMCRCYTRISQDLYDIGNLIGRRHQLETRLIAEVGADALVEGMHCRDVYFGEVEVEDA